MSINKIFQSRVFTSVLIIVGVVAAAVLILQAGIWVGYNKAAFSFRMGDNYYRVIGGPDGRFAPGLPHGDFPEVHGSAGRIIKIDLPTFVIEGREGLEKTVRIGDDTLIRRFRDELAPTDLHVDDSVVVIGAPDEQSQIKAKLIRLLPPPEISGVGKHL